MLNFERHKVFFFNRKYVSIFLLSIICLIRVLYVMNFPGYPITINAGDAKWYYETGKTLAKNHSYVRPAFVADSGAPTAYFPVGYVFFLCILFKIFGENIIVAQIGNCFLDVGIAILIFLFLKNMISEKLALTCAIWFVVSPSQILWTGFVFSEVLFVFLFFLHLYLLSLKNRHNRLVFFSWEDGGAGIALGLATLVRGQSLLFPLGSFMIIWLGMHYPVKQALKKTIWVTIFMCLTIAPWALRNVQVFGQFIPISNNGGVNLYIGNHEGATGGYSDPPLGYPGENELDTDHKSRDLALVYIKGAPFHFIQMGFVKLFKTFRADSILTFRQEFIYKWGNTTGWIAMGLAEFIYMINMALICFGLACGVYRDNAIARISIIVIAYFAVIIFIFFGGVRYMYPLNPFISILAAISFYMTIAQRLGIVDLEKA